MTQAPYSYVAGNPLNGTDPSGLYWGEGIVHDAGAVAHGAVTVAARTAATVVRATPAGQALDLVSHVTGKTVGGCIGGDVLGGIDLNGNICYLSTPSGQAGFTASGGVGLGFPVGFGATIGPSVSNARTLNDLSGPFGYVWGSAGKGPIAAGGSYEWGKNGCGDTIWQATAGWSPDFHLPTPYSFGGGVNNTWTAASW